jgi:ATP-dependent Clp protease ATP-binding subunit ClpC
MIDRFSPHAREALAQAEREARSLKHAQIGTEHILLGLLRVEESAAAQGLRLLGVTYRKARRRISALVDVGPAKVTGPIAFTARVREVLEDAFTGTIWSQQLGIRLCDPAFAFRATRPFGRPFEVRSEQVLLALLAHGEGVAWRVLADLGVDIEKAATATTHVRFPLTVQQQFVLPWPPKPF